MPVSTQLSFLILKKKAADVFDMTQDHFKQLKTVLINENQPVPQSFANGDVNKQTPKLYTK
ncbi:DUF3231 family protein [Gracilibacillus alcaliphilus]|uniref:DUF3231 family protein n=1 Tax=Gracilibacillus alcaliphilus TaxID=1401441 RepID=UPI00195BB55E|nr:DUF3231 family protein [Gracilibacillus alcaliphilus]MBM7677806.1 hypothetical protein [Gracilibacillus alcaliphilus]